MLQYLHAVWHLKPIQIYGQLRNHLISRSFLPRFWTEKGNRADIGNRLWTGGREFLPPGIQTNEADRMKNGELEFLNESCRTGWPFDWSAACPGKLWEYNLHYFEYLFALEYDDAKRPVLDWIEKYPLCRGDCGWDPYPVYRPINHSKTGTNASPPATETERRFFVEKKKILLCWDSIACRVQESSKKPRFEFPKGVISYVSPGFNLPVLSPPDRRWNAVDSCRKTSHGQLGRIERMKRHQGVSLTRYLP